MTSLVEYAPGTSLLHRLNPVSKLALAVALISAIVLADTWAALVAMPLATIALAAHARVARRLLRLLALLAPLGLVMIALQALFVRTGEPVLGIVTIDGLASGGRACLRLLGVALPLVLMLAVTRLADLANACVEVLHLPYRYAFTVTTTLRLVPLLMQEMDAIVEAQTARGVHLDTKNPFEKLRLALPLCVPLLTTSVGKVDAIALAAEQRGFYLRHRKSSYKRFPIAWPDIIALVCCALLIACGIIW